MARMSLPAIASGEAGLSHYLAEIRKFPMLAPDEEYMLAKAYKEHDDRDADRISCDGNPPEGIDEQIATIAAATKLLVPPNHRDVGGGNVAMGRPCARKLCR